ncbi:APO 4, mitochondrial, partial [Olea europaea subsp. europaea]
MIFEVVLGRYKFYSSKSKPMVDLKKFRPVILKRIEEQDKEYPIKRLSPVAHEVLQARAILYHGVSTLI